MAASHAPPLHRDWALVRIPGHAGGHGQAVLDAAELVGLTVLALLPEHTAVALKYVPLHTCVRTWTP